MSLDVYLNSPDYAPCECKCGHKHESQSPTELYWANITHNLNRMAGEAGVYYAIWRPEEKGWIKASDIIPALESGLVDMKARPEHYKQFEPRNGWGTYVDFVTWIEKYLNACKENPTANIYVSR